jgi:hypothetical protein
MKKIIILLILSSAQVFSQMTLTSLNSFTVGDHIGYAECDTNVTQGNAGANQTWNFTGIVRVDTSTMSVVSSASTPYSGQFSGSNIATTPDNQSYNYFTVSAGNIMFNGNGAPGMVVSYNNPELFMQYPFTFNSSLSDNFGANYVSNGTPTVRTGTINITGDGWGTISLPIGTFTNALRVKYVIVVKDSSNPGAPVVMVTNTTSYVWWVPGKKYPIFEIVYSSLTFNGISFASTKAVNYTPVSNAIGIEQISSNVPNGFSLEQNYPNPFNPSAKIRFSIPTKQNVRLTVFDQLGNEVETLVNENLAAGTYEADFDGSGLSSGAYFYRFTAGEFTETKKMILVK